MPGVTSNCRLRTCTRSSSEPGVGSDVNQALGMVSLVPFEWFTPFDLEQACAENRGFRHP